MRDNYKKLGEKGVNVAIGELAKWDIQVAFPLSDNLPFDLILIYNNKLYKAQVKTGQKRLQNGTIAFKLTSNNWYTKTITKYSKEDIDLMILCDYDCIYLLSPSQFEGRASFVIRLTPSKNNQKSGINLAEDYVISAKRIQEVLV